MKLRLFFTAIVFAATVFSNLYSQNTLVKTDTIQIFQKYVDSLNPQNAATLDLAVNKYHQLFKSSSKFICDTAFIVFWHYYVSVADSLGAKFVQDEKYSSFYNIKDFDENPPADKKIKQNLKNKNKKLNESDFKILRLVNHYGFKFSIVEGMVLVSIASPRFILKNFSGWFSASMKIYITKVIEEIDSAYSSETEIIIPPDVVVNRLLWWENFIMNLPVGQAGNKIFFLIDDCKSTYNGYMYILMTGQGNSPAFDSQSGKLNDNFKNVYEKIMRRFKGTKSAEIISAYYNILRKNNFIRSNESEKFADQFFEY